jgi:hypothetical protein
MPLLPFGAIQPKPPMELADALPIARRISTREAHQHPGVKALSREYVCIHHQTYLLDLFEPESHFEDFQMICLY